MDLIEIGILGLVFVASVALVFWLGQQFADGPRADKRARRLLGQETAAPKKTPWIEYLARNTRSLARLSGEESGENSALRRRMFNAGVRSPLAPTAFFGTKTLLAVALPPLALGVVTLGAFPLEGNALLSVLLGVAAVGYYLPNMVLSHLVETRQREVFESFPDALDLMVICVEAGLGLESALQRVAEDLVHKSRVLSEELQLVGLELRAGAPRERALHNLALRTGVDEVDGFVSMLIQAERFGTSIAQAMRVHADMLRTRRRQRAEEAAAKVALKLLFPLILCILPSLMLVVAGPAMINIMKTLPTLTQNSQSQ
jgi:tight adherence protein C